MKITIGFQDRTLGQGEATGSEPIRWSGETKKFHGIVDFYANKSGLQGEALLKLLTERLRGQSWAFEVKSDSPAPVPAAEPASSTAAPAQGKTVEEFRRFLKEQGYTGDMSDAALQAALDAQQKT